MHTTKVHILTESVQYKLIRLGIHDKIHGLINNRLLVGLE